MGTHPDVDLYLEGVANFVVCTIGMGINAAAIGILCRQKTSSLFVKLMITLVSYDLIYVFLFATCYSLPRLYNRFDDHVFPHLAPFLVPITQMALSGSVYTTVALTVERYISVGFPFFRQRHNLKAWVFIVPVAIFIVGYNIPRFFELETVHKPVMICADSTNTTYIDSASGELVTPTTATNVSRCINFNETGEWMTNIGLTQLRTNSYYVSIYVNYLNLFVNIFLPLTSLVVMNICIYRIMRNQWYSQSVIAVDQSEQTVETRRGHFRSSKSSSRRSTMLNIRRGGHHEAEYKKRDAQYTRASLFMVVAFIVCNMPRFIPNIMEIFIEFHKWPQWGHVLVNVNHLLTVINSAFNFLIYWSFCCGKRRRRRSRRQREMLSQKTFTTHSFEMQSITNEPTLLRRSRHDTEVTTCHNPPPSSQTGF